MFVRACVCVRACVRVCSERERERETRQDVTSKHKSRNLFHSLLFVHVLRVNISCNLYMFFSAGEAGLSLFGIAALLLAFVTRRSQMNIAYHGYC